MPGIVIPAGDNNQVSLKGIGVVFKISGKETGGAFSVVEHPIEPGKLVVPHMHTREDEFSYVLEGEIGARIGDQEYHLCRGSYLFKPRGIPHTFWNPGPAPARLIEFVSPSGMEDYFTELAAILGTAGPPDVSKIMQLYARYGHTPDGMEWIPELSAKYGVRLTGQ